MSETCPLCGLLHQPGDSWHSNRDKCIAAARERIAELEAELVEARADDVSPTRDVKTSLTQSRPYRRGRIDGKMGHPAAEATEEYLLGYRDGLTERCQGPGVARTAGKAVWCGRLE